MVIIGHTRNYPASLSSISVFRLLAKSFIFLLFRVAESTFPRIVTQTKNSSSIKNNNRRHFCSKPFLAFLFFFLIITRDLGVLLVRTANIYARKRQFERKKDSRIYIYICRFDIYVVLRENRLFKDSTTFWQLDTLALKTSKMKCPILRFNHSQKQNFTKRNHLLSFSSRISRKQPSDLVNVLKLINISFLRSYVGQFDQNFIKISSI